MYEYISYIFIIIVIILFICYSYIKLKYGFWLIQPVFHLYDIRYLIFPPGIIEHELPQKNKYTNFKDIETFYYEKTSDHQLQRFVHFINFNYLQNKDNVFMPSLENVSPYFKGHNDKPFISFYTQPELIMDVKTNTTLEERRIIGTITSRPIHVSINKGEKDSSFDAYYVDYLCVDKLYRKQGIAPQMIQTHHYNQRHLNKKIVVSLFKREDELTGIVPLCLYSTYGFSMKNWNKPYDLPAMYTILEINAHNFHFLYDFIRTTSKAHFKIVINSEVANIIELIKTKNIYSYVLMKDDVILCAYFYRKTCVFYEKNVEILSCFASINNFDKNDKEGERLFIQGFKISFWKTAQSNENQFKFAVLEGISHNQIIIDNLSLKTKPQIVSPTAYFFYNFAYHSFKPKDVLIIN
uniref:glycylpeptide N-tetradecanoyltransferase n=1 Tax=viral metagenome TaxID=1070528 RepID=A0A6C0DG97_9ZZZZ